MDRPSFTRTRWLPGYGRAEVDAAVERIMAGALTADEVRELTFPDAENRPGYRMGEVDAWLAQVYVALGGRPVEGPELAWPPPDLEPDRTAMSEAAMDRWQAAAIIVVTLVVTVLIYVSRF